jgi:signal transduction histidine kinase
VLAERVLQALAAGTTIEREEVALGTPPRPITLTVQFISSLAGGDASGEDQVVLVSLRDVESVRRLESQIELSHRLTAISRLTSGVAHEVKNPLNAMVLHVEAMKSKLSQPSTEESRAGLAEHLEIIAKEVYRLDRVVKTFFDFARPVELRIQETELKPLVEEVLRLAEAEAQPRQVRVVFDVRAPLARVRVDRDLIKQALLNIVLNACQAMPEGGQLSISQATHDGQVEIEVADQGVGIPAEIRDKIFNLYFTTREQGSGIGLPLAFRACQLHNGRLDFVSETGRGTTFRIQLPLAA